MKKLLDLFGLCTRAELIKQSDRLRQLEKDYMECYRDRAKAQTQLDSVKQENASLEKKIKSLQQSLRKDEKIS